MTDPQKDTSSTPETGIARRLWREYIKPYWPMLALAIVFMVVQAVAESGTALATAWVFSAFEEQKGGRFTATPDDVMVWGPWVFIGIGLLAASAMFIQALMAQGIAVKVLRDLQKSMFRNFLTYDYAQTREDGAGQLVSRFTNDTTILRESLTRVPNALRDFIRLIISIAVMLWLDYVLFLVILFTYPAVAIPVTMIGKYIRRVSKRVQRQIGDMTALLTESMRGARLVKTYRMEPYEQARADAAFDERETMLQRLIRLRAANEPIIMVIGTIAFGIVVGVGAWRYKQGALEGGELIAFIVQIVLLSAPIRNLGTLNAVIQEGMSALERVFWVIDRTPQITDGVRAEPLVLDHKIQGAAISLRHVSFDYGGEGDESPKALNDFSLEVPAGKTVALVGESGAGKSTVFNLIPRLYDIQTGEILINGQEISTVTIETLRDAIALVSQDAIMFDDTIRANIAFGRPGASDAEITQAARAAAAEEFILTFPGRYQTSVGEGGGNLSGGQRQRISLARAFLKDAPILLLDEATSALDVESEMKVQAALRRLSEGRTTLVIAHRLATVRDADVICVMDKGQIIEQGGHEELIAKGGAYARLSKLQFTD
ncbi:MAG: ABC transporter ATP-binding protein [Parvularculaceae bacterium]